ncbi:MAG TPA: radical SAM protein [Bacteroidales bacterium]|nr:radical SAM protein [Bacteroidales bacterium]
MFDRFNRRINYLRISVTDRCNLKCRYCMPEGNVRFFKPGEILSFEEIREAIKVAVSLGIDKIRLTGGEPLVRKDIVDLVRMIASVEGIKDLSLTTNGLLLNGFALPLADAGLTRINVSLDTLDPIKFSALTRGGNLDLVLAGIEAAKSAGLNPIKVNCVIKSNHLEPDAVAVKNFCNHNGLVARFIKQMDLQNGHFERVEGGSGGDCASCNRLRLTSNGMIKPCLFSNSEFNIRHLGVRQAIEMALAIKPAKGAKNLNNCFHNIGG